MMAKAVESNRHIYIIDLTKNPVPLNFIEEIEQVLE
jgi:hypothetical protein